MDFASWFNMEKFLNPKIKDRLERKKEYFIELWNNEEFESLKKEVENLKLN